jgi:hypothetical protein
MKVSRKVRRRKHSRSSSISRRRLRKKNSKSGYRKKHTQRGGGCYRSKKVGVRSRKYKRARTYKRVERFHKGGMNPLEKAMNDHDIAEGKQSTKEVITDANGIKQGFGNGKYSISITDEKRVDVQLLPYHGNCVIVFNVKRITGGFFPTQSQRFYCNLTFVFDKSNPKNQVKYFFSLKREDNQDIEFSVSGQKKMTNSILNTNATSQQILVEKLKSSNFLKTMQYFKDDKTKKPIDYDFSDSANLGIFEALADIISDNGYTEKAFLTAFPNYGTTAPTPAQTPAQIFQERAKKNQEEERQDKKILEEEKQKIIKEIEEIGDNLEVTFEGQQNALKISELKSDLMKLAASSIEKIKKSNLGETSNKMDNEFITLLLLQILFAQYKVIKQTYLLTKLKELNKDRTSVLYNKVPEGQTIDTDIHISSKQRTLLEQTGKVREIIQQLGDIKYNYIENYFNDKRALLFFIDSLIQDDDIDKAQKEKLEQEINDLVSNVGVQDVVTGNQEVGVVSDESNHA